MEQSNATEYETSSNDMDLFKEKPNECKNKYRAKNKLSQAHRKYYIKNREKILKHKREFFDKNKEKIRERSRKYAAENPRQLAVYHQEYYIKNKEKIIEQRKKYRDKNKDRYKEYVREYYAKNAQKICESSRSYYARNKERIKERKNNVDISQKNKKRREYYARNREKLKAYFRKYREKNQEKDRAKGREYYQKKKERFNRQCNARNEDSGKVHCEEEDMQNIIKTKDCIVLVERLKLPVSNQSDVIDDISKEYLSEVSVESHRNSISSNVKRITSCVENPLRDRKSCILVKRCDQGICVEQELPVVSDRACLREMFLQVEKMLDCALV